MKKIHSALFAVSIVFNVLVVLLAALLIVFVIGAKPKSLSMLSFYRLEQTGAPVGGAAACVVSLPKDAEIAFGELEITLRKGESCSIQYSLFQDGGQLNLAFDPLYDREIVSINRSGFGLLVRALAEGQCVLQFLSNGGIKTAAVITVTE